MGKNTKRKVRKPRILVEIDWLCLTDVINVFITVHHSISSIMKPT
jgi:hypothetical protein